MSRISQPHRGVSDVKAHSKPKVGIPFPEFNGNHPAAPGIARSQVISPQQKADLNQPGAGILTVTLCEAVGLPAPKEYEQKTQSSVHDDGSSTPKWLPYVVLCHGHSWAKVARPAWDSGGTLWKFDVLRASELMILLFAHYADEDSTSSQGQDISQGMVKIKWWELVSENGKPRTVKPHWFDIQEGTGKICVGFEYIPNETPTEMGDVWSVNLTNHHQFGSIPACRKASSQQLYTLKTITPKQTGPWSRLIRFCINSTFIAPLAFASQSLDDGLLHLLCPFVPGGHLFYYLQRDRCFDNDRARLYAAEILCALEHLHVLGMAYEGLRPEKVMVDWLGHIAIVDPELFFPKTEEDGSGILRYPAPETLRGQGHSQTSDWWTLGVFLHEMLLGLPPFYDEVAAEKNRKILSDEVGLEVPRDRLSEAARDILSKLLNRNPHQRLGAQGASEIKAHPFFAGLDWDQVAQRGYKLQFQPRLIATVFLQESVPKKTMAGLMQDFIGFKYKRPITGPGGIPFVDESDSKIATGDKETTSMVKQAAPVSTTTSPNAAPPRPQATTTEPQDHKEHDDNSKWQLVWDVAARTFFFHNPATNVTTAVPVSATREKSQTQLSGNQDVPTQPQKQAVLEAALSAGRSHEQAIMQLVQEHGPVDLNFFLLFDGYRRSTPLEWVTEHENTRLVELFLAHAADPNSTSFAVDEKGQLIVRDTALLRAVKKGNAVLAEMLLASGATDRVLGTRALGLAVQQNDRAMVSLLLAHGVHCDFEEDDRPPPAHPLAGCFFVDVSYAKEFLPPLVRAVALGDVELVRHLLAHGADPNVGFHDLNGITTRQYRTAREEQWAQGGPPTVRCGRVVQLAMDFGDGDVVRTLLEAGADVKQKQPVWRHHECMMMRREDYFRITSRLRVEAAALGCGSISSR